MGPIKSVVISTSKSSTKKQPPFSEIDSLVTEVVILKQVLPEFEDSTSDILIPQVP